MHNISLSPNILWLRMSRTVLCTGQTLNVTGWRSLWHLRVCHIILWEKPTRLHKSTNRLSQELWTMSSDIFTGWGPQAHDMNFPLMQSFILIFQILLWVMLLLLAFCVWFSFLKTSCNTYLLNLYVKEWNKHVYCFQKGTEKQAFVCYSYLYLNIEVTKCKVKRKGQTFQLLLCQSRIVCQLNQSFAGYKILI